MSKSEPNTPQPIVLARIEIPVADQTPLVLALAAVIKKRERENPKLRDGGNLVRLCFFKESDRLNFYEYANCNPVSFRDPSGNIAIFSGNIASCQQALDLKQANVSCVFRGQVTAHPSRCPPRSTAPAPPQISRAGFSRLPEGLVLHRAAALRGKSPRCAAEPS